MSEQSVNAFIKAVKEKRNEACAQYEVDLVAEFDGGGKPDWHGLVEKAIDKAVMGVLDLVEERFDEIASIGEVAVDDELVNMVQVTPDLATLYFTEVSS